MRAWCWPPMGWSGEAGLPCVGSAGVIPGIPEATTRPRPVGAARSVTPDGEASSSGAVLMAGLVIIYQALFISAPEPERPAPTKSEAPAPAQPAQTGGGAPAPAPV